MAVYSVHMRPISEHPNPDEFVFVRDGFSLWAFLFGPFWMLRHRLWLVLLIYVAVLIALAAALIVGVLVYTLFIRAQDVPPPEPVCPLAHLEDRKAAIYENLRDLQFEFRVGKLSEADYQKTKLDLQRELAKVMAEIDAMQPAPAKAAVAAPAKTKPDGRTCPHCAATFPRPMKFCGECGKAMA